MPYTSPPSESSICATTAGPEDIWLYHPRWCPRHPPLPHFQVREKGEVPSPAPPYLLRGEAKVSSAPSLDLEPQEAWKSDVCFKEDTSPCGSACACRCAHEHMSVCTPACVYMCIYVYAHMLLTQGLCTFVGLCFSLRNEGNLQQVPRDYDVQLPHFAGKESETQGTQDHRAGSANNNP